MFPVRYGLDLYIKSWINSVFKRLMVFGLLIFHIFWHVSPLKPGERGGKWRVKIYIWGVRNISGLEGSQAVPASPSGQGTLERRCNVRKWRAPGWTEKNHEKYQDCRPMYPGHDSNQTPSEYKPEPFLWVCLLFKWAVHALTSEL
jgi:hypothetical protein